MSLDAIFDCWSLVEADFHEVYGVDLEAVHADRSWRWFMVRVGGLLACDSRLNRHFYRPEQPELPDPFTDI